LPRHREVSDRPASPKWTAKQPGFMIFMRIINHNVN